MHYSNPVPRVSKLEWTLLAFLAAALLTGADLAGLF